MKFFAVLSILAVAVAVPPFAKSLRLDAITDSEILVLTKSLHESDVNGMVVTLDLQTKTTAGNFNDLSPNPLFVNVPTDDFAKPTYAATFGLLNNFQKNVTIEDTFTAAQLEEVSVYLDTILATSVMQDVRRFLFSHGLESAVDDATFKPFLDTIWFGRYANIVPGVKASGGWEHANIFERLQDNTVVGCHSWVYYFDEEDHGDCNYLGYVNSLDTGKTTIISIPLDMYGSLKAQSEFNVGASPELEFALGTLCFVARPDQPCLVQGSNSAIYAMDVHTVTIDGVQYIESSHPTFEMDI